MISDAAPLMLGGESSPQEFLCVLTSDVWCKTRQLLTEIVMNVALTVGRDLDPWRGLAQDYGC